MPMRRSVIDRCDGTGRMVRSPIERALDRSRSREIALGECPVCGGWIGVNRDRTVRPHVNWTIRRARERVERRRPIS
jgi:RNA polymerase-binding transcription factor DksA